MKKTKETTEEIKKIPAAPLYKVALNTSTNNIRVFPLMKAEKSESGLDFTYPAKHGKITIPIKELCNISKDFTSYCLRKDLELVKSSISALLSGTITIKNASKSKEEEKHAAVVVAIPNIENTYNENLFTGENLKDVKAINKILSGDKNAFEFLFNKYFPIIKQKYIRNLKMDVELSEDLTIEFLTKLYEKIILRVYNQDFTVSAMVSKMSTNFLIDYSRKKKLDTFSIDKNLEFEDGNESSFELPDMGSMNGAEQLTSVEMKEYVKNLIFRLDDREKSMIEMVYFEERKIKDISVELGIPEGTIKVLLMRSKKKMVNMIISDNGCLGIDKKTLREKILFETV